MFRLCILLVSASVSWVVLVCSPIHVSQSDDLKSQRIAFLEQRIEVVDTGIKAERLAPVSRIQPQIDLIKAKLEYASNNIERKNLYKELLAQFDLLIEQAEARVATPEVSSKPGRDQNILNESDLLKLKADRIAIQIEAAKNQ